MVLKSIKSAREKRKVRYHSRCHLPLLCPFPLSPFCTHQVVNSTAHALSSLAVEASIHLPSGHCLWHATLSSSPSSSSSSSSASPASTYSLTCPPFSCTETQLQVRATQVQCICTGLSSLSNTSHTIFPTLLIHHSHAIYHAPPQCPNPIPMPQPHPPPPSPTPMPHPHAPPPCVFPPRPSLQTPSHQVHLPRLPISPPSPPPTVFLLLRLLHCPHPSHPSAPLPSSAYHSRSSPHLPPSASPSPGWCEASTVSRNVYWLTALPLDAPSTTLSSVASPPAAPLKPSAPSAPSEPSEPSAAPLASTAPPAPSEPSVSAAPSAPSAHMSNGSTSTLLCPTSLSSPSPLTIPCTPSDPPFPSAPSPPSAPSISSPSYAYLGDFRALGEAFRHHNLHLSLSLLRVSSAPPPGEAGTHLPS
ncbi:unnamed protein product, partial [Closterium sp. NIES-53]